MTLSTDTPQRTPPSLAAIDGDILAYRAAAYADQMGVDELEGRLDADLEAWTPDCCDRVIIMFSDDRTKIFRRDYWPTYKDHRKAFAKPDSLGYAVDILKERAKCMCVDRMEADDLLGIMTSEQTAVCVTTDKDLRQVPGWHWNPDKQMDDPILIDEVAGSRWFHTQWISGDSTDHFPGIPGIGPAKSSKLILDRLPPHLWTLGVMAAFESRKFNLEYALAQRACAKIITKDDWDVTTCRPKVYVW
jgi:5'-3' exonuclease